MNWLNNVSVFDIVLDRKSGTYMAGEQITGHVRLRIKSGKEIKCRGVRMGLEGRSYTKIIEKRNDDPDITHIARRCLVRKASTVHGNFYPTECLDGCGADAFFDPNTGAGEIPIHLEEGESPENIKLVVRAMDMDWGKKDDLLGEVLITFGDDGNLPLNGEQKSFPCTRRGRNEKGEITLTAESKEHTNGDTYIDLRCVQATGLRSAEMFSFGGFGNKNDVYVQAYKVDADYEAKDGVGLPNPESNIILDGGLNLEKPFTIKLPDKALPSSVEFGGGGYNWGHGRDGSYVRYYLQCNIDIAWWGDPTAKKFITVLSSDLPHPNLFQPLLKPMMIEEPVYGCDCGIIKLCEQGAALFNCAIDKRYIAPGDLMWVTAHATNKTEKLCKLTIKLRIDGVCKAGPQTEHYSREFEMFSEDLMPGQEINWTRDDPKDIMCPLVPPTYQPVSNSWFKKKEPVVWKYFIEFRLDMPGMMTTDIIWRFPVMVGAWPVGLLIKNYPEYAKVMEAEETKKQEDVEDGDTEVAMFDASADTFDFFEDTQSMGDMASPHKSNSRDKGLYSHEENWHPSYPTMPADLLAPKPPYLPRVNLNDQGPEIKSDIHQMER